MNYQKQLKSWSTSDNFSSRVIYDSTRKSYVGVFSKLFLRFWKSDTEDINKIKKIKLNKTIHEISNVKLDGKEFSLVVYEDGSAESLESALESRSEGGSNVSVPSAPSEIDNVQFTNGIFSYTKKSGNDKYFCYTTVDERTLKTHDNVKLIKLERSGQDVKLSGLTVIEGKRDKCDPSLVTVWSDKRLFKQPLSPSENYPTIGTFHSIVDSINATNRLHIAPISQDCIAIYASRDGDDGSFVCIYNIKYKIIQSKVPFKVYLSNFRLWSFHKNIFLAMGEQLSVIPYRITTDHLSSMVGSQCDSKIFTTVEKEMINEDLQFEENIEFDDNQEPVENMDYKIQGSKCHKTFQTPLSKAKVTASADEVNDQLSEIYRDDLMVDIVRMESTFQAKLLSNVDETLPMLQENFELLCVEMEKCGCSEVEITNKVIPVLIKTNRTEDLGLLLKRYNHVSEEMLMKTIKYLLSCSTDQKLDNVEDHSKTAVEVQKDQLKVEKKLANANIFLNTKQNRRRDALSLVLCCSFDSPTIIKFLRQLTLNEMTDLMDHIYSMLTSSSVDDCSNLRGNLVDGCDFDLDVKLFEWFKLLLDSHYQPILLSHNKDLHKRLEQWLKLVDDHIKILSDMSDLRQVLAKLSTCKPLKLVKKCNKYYKIEKLELY